MPATTVARKPIEARRLRAGFHGELSVITRCLGSDSVDRPQLYIHFDRIYGSDGASGATGAGGVRPFPPAGGVVGSVERETTATGGAIGPGAGSAAGTGSVGRSGSKAFG